MVRNTPKRGHKAAKGGHLFSGEDDNSYDSGAMTPEEYYRIYGTYPEDYFNADNWTPEALARAGYADPQPVVVSPQNPAGGERIETAPPASDPTKPRVILEGNSKMNPLRYAPIGASVGAVLADAFGATNNPVIFDELPGYYNVGFSPLANYIPVTHTDTRYQQIQNAQEAAAARNALMQSTSPSRNNAILAADFNAQIANGELLRQGELQDYERMLKREEFNRATNQQNTNWGLNTALANREYGLNLGKARFQQALATDESSNNMMGAKGHNIENAAEALGYLGREKDAMDWRDMLLRAGVYGTLSEKPANWTEKEWEAYQNYVRTGVYSGANGGKIKRKKKGLTY
jgi:hypothetical protein